MPPNPYAAPKFDQSPNELTREEGWTPQRVATISWGIFRRHWRGYLAASFTNFAILALFWFLLREFLAFMVSDNGGPSQDAPPQFWRSVFFNFAPIAALGTLVAFITHSFVRISLAGVRGEVVHSWLIFQARGFHRIVAIAFIGLVAIAPLFTLAIVAVATLFPSAEGAIAQISTVLSQAFVVPCFVPFLLAMYFAADGTPVRRSLVAGLSAVRASPLKLLSSILGSYVLWLLAAYTRVGGIFLVPLIFTYWAVIYLLAAGGELGTTKHGLKLSPES